MSELVEMHRRNLPHIQLQRQIIALTWRLAFTLPQHMVRLLDELRITLRFAQNQPMIDYSDYYARLEKYDLFLGGCSLGHFSLCEQVIGHELSDAFKFYAGKLYYLHAYCVMPNHVHLLIQPLADGSGTFVKTSTIVQRLKSYTSKRINEHRHKEGRVWCSDYFDRYIRNEKDYYNVVNYILNNPVKAGLADDPAGWQYSYFDDLFHRELPR